MDDNVLLIFLFMVGVGGILMACDRFWIGFGGVIAALVYISVKLWSFCAA